MPMRDQLARFKRNGKFIYFHVMHCDGDAADRLIILLSVIHTDERRARARARNRPTCVDFINLN